MPSSYAVATCCCNNSEWEVLGELFDLGFHESSAKDAVPLRLMVECCLTDRCSDLQRGPLPRKLVWYELPRAFIWSLYLSVIPTSFGLKFVRGTLRDIYFDLYDELTPGNKRNGRTCFLSFFKSFFFFWITVDMPILVSGVYTCSLIQWWEFIM